MRMALLVLCLALTACGSDHAGTTATPLPAPAVTLTAEDKQVWAPTAPDRSEIPVLVYHGIGEPGDFADPHDAAYSITQEAFAKQMELLHYAGYRTVTMGTFDRFVRGEHVDLPAHPLLLTFDDARLDSWIGGDETLRKLGYTAVMFADVGHVEAGNPEYLSLPQLADLQASGRWDVEVHSGRGHKYIHYGPGEKDYGPFYAYREQHESFDGWDKRVINDIGWGSDQLAKYVPGFDGLAFTPPYGTYGQDGTNDDRIPGTLLTWLEEHFHDVFTQDVGPFAKPHASQPLGRIQITKSMTGGELHSLLNP